MSAIALLSSITNIRLAMYVTEFYEHHGLITLRQAIANKNIFPKNIIYQYYYYIK